MLEAIVLNETVVSDVPAMMTFGGAFYDDDAVAELIEDQDVPLCFIGKNDPVELDALSCFKDYGCRFFYHADDRNLQQSATVRALSLQVVEQLSIATPERALNFCNTFIIDAGPQQIILPQVIPGPFSRSERMYAATIMGQAARTVIAAIHDDHISRPAECALHLLNYFGYAEMISPDYLFGVNMRKQAKPRLKYTG